MARSQTAICIEMHMKSGLHGEVGCCGTQKWDWWLWSLCSYRSHLPSDSCRHGYSAIILIPLGFRLASELSSKAFRRALCRWEGELMMAATSGAFHCAPVAIQQGNSRCSAQRRPFPWPLQGCIKYCWRKLMEFLCPSSTLTTDIPLSFLRERAYTCRWVDPTSVTVLQFNFELGGCWFLTLLDVR